MLTQRIIFGTLMIAAIVGLLIADEWMADENYFDLLEPGVQAALFAILIVVLIGLGTVEVARMARAKGLGPLSIAGAVVAAALAVSPFLARLDPALEQMPLWAIGLGLWLILLAQAIRHRVRDAIPNIAATLLIAIFLGGLGLFAMMIRLEFAVWGLALFIAAVKFTDIGAYFVGGAFGLGRTKIAPWVSPAKSWEGLAGGMLLAMGVSLAIGWSAGVLGWWQCLVFGAIMAPVGQMADMAVSMLKRDSGLKDSGSVVPGFGGLLDVLDSPLGGAPVAYLLLIWLG
jgi:phosphatidate cytidylyltransferase